MSKIYPANFEIKIEFTKIRELIKNHCLSFSGKEKVNEMQFLTNAKEIEYLLSLTSEFKHILQYNNKFPTSFFIDTKAYFEKTKNLDSYLLEKELFDILRSLNTIKQIIYFFKKDTDNNYPTLKALTKEIQTFPFVVDLINSVLDKYGEIKDSASPELRKIRNDLSKKQSSVSTTIHKIFRKEVALGNVEKDAEITVRENKLLIPVEAKNKRKIQGIIFDESATGKTSYIEPIEVIMLNNEIRELHFAEIREIRIILTNITNELRPYFYDLQESYKFMANIDFIRAKALFAVDIDANKPKLIEVNEIEFLKARHPLLHLSLKKSNKKVVPSSIKINENQRILIISGPNAGGKSVSLKTIASLQYMLQCGLLIPVQDISVTGIFNNIFIDIGDEQSIENDLSTYSSHLNNMKFFTENSDNKTLILIDEFGTGTEPMLGGAIAEAVLENLYESGTRGVITTHYTNLKHFADKNKNVANAEMLYDGANMLPLYKMEIGRPGSSFAFEIAEKTGLKASILQNAKSKIDSKQIDFEKALKQAQTEKRKLKQSKRNIRQSENKLKETLERYEIELEKLLTNKKEVLKKAKIEAEEILNSANKKIEKTILEIRRKGAEKEQTKKLRKELNDYILNEKEKRNLEQEKIKSKIEKLKNKKKKRKKNNDNSQKEILEEREIKVSDFVKIIGTNTVGEILSINKNKITIISNNVQFTVNKNRLELTKQIKRKPIKTSINLIVDESKIETNFYEQLDVRGKRADDALQIVTRYIDDAVVSQNTSLKILHGTGNGILRQVIRDFLRSHQLVKSYRDERIEAGGSGITLFELDI